MANKKEKKQNREGRERTSHGSGEERFGSERKASEFEQREGGRERYNEGRQGKLNEDRSQKNR